MREQNVRMVDDRTRNRNSLLLATGKSARFVLQAVCDA
jgi:hypothetical protein